MDQEALGQVPASDSYSYGPVLATTFDWVQKNPTVAANMVAALVEGEQFIRDAYLRHDKKKEAAVLAIAEKYTGITDAAAIQSQLPLYARISQPVMSCSRLFRQAQQDVTLGEVGAIAPCSQLIVQKYIPKKLLK